MKNFLTNSTINAALKFFQYWFLIPSIILLTSCTMFGGPEYTRPEVPEKKEWSPDPSSISPKDVIQPDWWTGFEDEYLDQLIEQAISANYNLKILASRLKEAGIAVGVEETSKLPRVEATARTAFDLRSGTVESPDHNLNIALSWELDIWGKLEKGIDASKATYKSIEAIWRGGYLKLVADVATKYFEIRQFDQQILSKQQSLDQYIIITDIYRNQHAEGLVSLTKVLKQEAEVNGTRKDLLDLNRQRDITENELSTLLGISAGEFHVPVTTSYARITIPIVPGGLPSDLLNRRPDILSAEYLVLSSHYLVGKSKLELFPTISMTSSGGLINNVISGALKSYTFGLGPTVNFPIFDPARYKNIESTEVAQQSAIAEYRETIIRAFAEVENTLVNLHSRKQQEQQLKLQVEKLTIIKDQVIERLKEGMVSQLEVLEAERSLISNELSLLNVHQQILTDTVTLYKALGGGWPIEYVNSTTEIIVDED